MARIYSGNRTWYFCEASQLWKLNPEKRVTKNTYFYDQVLQAFQPNRDGVSGWIKLADLKAMFPTKRGCFGGGGDTNGSNIFTRTGPGKDFIFISDVEHAPTARQMGGIKFEQQANRSIRSDIIKVLSKRPCVMLGINSKVQVDHKNGRYVDHALAPERQRADQFQPLCETANKAKRSHCSACQRDNKRFDARLLGYPIGWLYGDAQYRGSCQGCFWYDPIAFRSALASPKAV